MAARFVFTESSSSTSTLGFLTQHEDEEEGERSISVASWTWDNQFTTSDSDNPRLWRLPSDQLLAFSVVHNCYLGELEELKKLIEKRWQWMRRPIHDIATLLHPLWKSNDLFMDTSLLEARDAYISRIYSEEEQMQIDTEISMYQNNVGVSFSRNTSRRREICVKPIEWWETYGYSTPYLRVCALRILSQDCSSGACKRNWSSYSLIHTKIRNRLKTTQLEKLVYCRANLRLLRKLKTLAGPMQTCSFHLVKSSSKLRPADIVLILYISSECWIADGPVVVIVGGQKILIARGGSLEDSNCLETFANTEKDERGWTLYEMNFKDFEGEIKLAIIYCGSLRSPQPELLFSVEYLSSKEDDANKMISGRSSSDWLFIRLGLDTVVSWPKESDSEKVPFGSAYTTCKELFPKDVHPNLISCVTFAPSNPLAPALLLSSWPEQGMKSMWDLFIGCVDGNILKCRLGNIVGKTILTGSPCSLRFTTVAGGQGIILAVLNDAPRSVIAVCAETLVHLKVWTRVEDIAVGDVQLMGHNQIVLFLSSESDGCDSKASYHPFHSPQIHITDLARSICVGPQKVSQFAEGAIQEHKANILGNICKSLSMRVEAGLKYVKKLEDQRSTKIELVRSSCRLMQDIVFQNESLKQINESGSALNEGRYRCFTSSAFHQFSCGRTWFLMVDIEVSTARLRYLRNLSLLLTSLDGCIAGSSSVTESLMPGSVKERLVTAVPLKDIPTSQGLPIINLFVTSSLLPTEESDVEVCLSDKEAHTEWIGRIKLESHVFTSSSPPEDIPLDFRKVAPKLILVIKAKGEHETNFIDDVFQTALKMKRRSSPSDLEAYELVSSNNTWADASIVHNEKTFFVTLRAEDLRHLSALKACLISALPNQFEFVPSVSHPKCQGMIEQGLECLEEELLVEKALLSSMQGEEREIRKEMELQMATDHCISSLLKYGF